MEHLSYAEGIVIIDRYLLCWSSIASACVHVYPSNIVLCPSIHFFKNDNHMSCQCVKWITLSRISGHFQFIYNKLQRIYQLFVYPAIFRFMITLFIYSNIPFYFIFFFWVVFQCFPPILPGLCFLAGFLLDLLIRKDYLGIYGIFYLNQHRKIVYNALLSFLSLLSFFFLLQQSIVCLI